MRQLKTILCVMLFFTVLRVTSAAETTVHIAVSPWAMPEQREKQYDQIRAFLLKQAVPGTHVTLWDGWTLEVLGEATVPALVYDNAAARAQNRDIAPLLTGLKKWLDAPQGKVPGLVGTSALRAPELLQEIGGTPAKAGRVVILIGSPLYRNVTEPTFSMVEGRYPSDGQLRCTLVDSVYGVAEKQGRLNHTFIHWAIPGLNEFENELHQYAVTRFWTLFVQGQGGTLATMRPDLPQVLERAFQPDLAPVLAVQPDPADEKPQMRSAKPRSEPVWLEQIPTPPTPEQKVASNPPVAELAPAIISSEPVPVAELVVAPPPAPVVSVAPLIEAVPPPPPVVAAVVAPPPLPEPSAPSAPVPVPVNFDNKKVGIGIAWSAPVDLDLYVCAHPGAKEIYYRRDTTPEGFLYKDIRSANTGKNYEFIEFTGAVDLSQVAVWVNYYGGHASNVSGQVAIFDHGKVRVGAFALSVDHGNQGSASSSRANNPYWTEVRLADLVEATSPLAAHKPGEN